MPAPRVAELWAERTPVSFVFDLKAFRLFTQHQTPPRVLPKDIQEALGPLAEKKNVYYADFPPELMDECGTASSSLSSRSDTPASSAPCCFSSRRGSTIGARTWRISRIARRSWRASARCRVP